MKRSLFLLGTLLVAFFTFHSAQAGDIRHTYGGDFINSFYLDNLGGSVDNGGHDHSYYLSLSDINQSAFGTLLLYADDGTAVTVDDGLVDQDFLNLSGIFKFPLSVLEPNLLGEIGLADEIPLTPVSFIGESGLIVEQISYTSGALGDNFVIVEYRVVNPRDQAVEAQIALANDFDVDQKSLDQVVGYLGSPFPTVFQQDGPPIDPTFTTVGVSLLHGEKSQHRLEICGGPFAACPIFSADDDLIRQGFFEGVAGEVGDLTQGVTPSDYAVTIAADLGSIEPQSGVSAVFCYSLGQGENADEALDNLESTVNDCETFYQTHLKKCGNGLINFGEECDDTNNNDHDSCPSGNEGSCQIALCGDGIIWNQDGGNEECDDGNADNTDECTALCHNAECGDGFIQASNNEACDDSNRLNGDGCDSNCQIEVPPPPPPPPSVTQPLCGNGIAEEGEQCDDGNALNNDLCSTTCQLLPYLQGGGNSESTTPPAASGCSLALTSSNENLNIFGLLALLGLMSLLILRRFCS